MTVVNRVPLNTIPEEWAFHPVIGPFVRDLLTLVWQLRNRVGGDGDLVQELVIQTDDSMASAVESRVAALEARLEAIATEHDFSTRLVDLESKIEALVREHDFSSRLAAIESKLSAIEIETNIPQHTPDIDQDMQNTLIYDLIERIKAIEVQI